MTTTMITKFISSQSTDNINGAIDRTLANNVSGTVADYDGSFRVFVLETKTLGDVNVLCAGGSYISNGLGTPSLTGLPAPFHSPPYDGTNYFRIAAT